MSMPTLARSFIRWNRELTGRFVSWSASAFGRIDDCESDFFQEVHRVQARRVIELGGANRPVFQQSALSEYIGIDIDDTRSARSSYSTYFAQPCEHEVVDPRCTNVDLVLSKYLLEHTRDNRLVFANIRRWLSPTGRGIHLLPLRFHPYSIANRLAGNRVARRLIPILRPETTSITGYPAFYHLCDALSLPRELRAMGFEFEIKYFFGAEDYFGFFAPLGISLHIFNRVAHRFGLTFLASNAVIVMWVAAQSPIHPVSGD